MGSASVRVFFEDGRVAWGSFDPDNDEAGPVLWPSRTEAEQARSSEISERFRASERGGSDVRAVHSQLGSIAVDFAGCQPVAVEAIVGGVAQWWTGLATGDGRILATNREANEVHVKEWGLFRAHPDYRPSHIKVTGPAWADVDWSDVDPSASPAAPGA